MEKCKVTVLGTGGSMGVPVIGCECETCRSPSSHNKRLRSAILVEMAGKKIVVDAGPDFREQALTYNIKDLDGVIITHMHFDHIAGIDDVRVYNYMGKKAVPCMMTARSFADFERKYYYLLGDRDETITKAAKLDFLVVEQERGEVEFAGIPLKMFTYSQAHMEVMGLRFGNFAYVTDIKEFPETLWKDLEGVEVLMVSALREEPSLVHFNVDEAVAFAKKVGVKQAYLTHIAHEIEHHKVTSYLPEGVNLGYDGLTFEVE